MRIILDKSKKSEKIKPVNGVQNGPLTHYFCIDTTQYFKEAGFPYSRLHDTEECYGAGEFVNIHCIFPDLERDADDPRSYNFTATDEYIKAIYEAGTEVFYRLGESIEVNPRFKRHVVPPKDYEKWASVCEHIIAHYNEGWANGYNYGIKYWEIWNEPENPPMWTGTKQQFFKLYEITANRLKKRFPDCRIGGYGSCGFYSMDPAYTDPFYKSFITYAEDFLTYITDEKTKAPLDFFSWHVYTDNPAQMADHAVYCRQLLDKYGFTNTESILDEWNYNTPDDTGGKSRKSMTAAAFVGDMLVRMQKLPVDKAMYYDAEVMRLSYCGLFNEYTAKPEKPYYAMLAFNKVKRFGDPVCSEDNGAIRTLASTDGKGFCLMVTNYSSNTEEIIVECADAQSICIDTLDDKNDLTRTATRQIDGEAVVNVGKNTVLLLWLN